MIKTGNEYWVIDVKHPTDRTQRDKNNGLRKRLRGRVPSNHFASKKAASLALRESGLPLREYRVGPCIDVFF